MINYVTIGTTDLTASAVFFDALFGAVGGTRAYTLEHMIGYSFGTGKPMIIVTYPFDGRPASNGNGTMIALSASDHNHVDTVHALALEHGATDEGVPGQRGKNFYGGYFRDPDGNKFNISISS
ncbi:VOC family protein [Cognatiyoonia sp. IB215182]|uniref:VOC family protein n=1 Tax=Cognatiyoonia sp. IB215182 TaxID=3097353 RepID=UPI002A0D7AE2|nr:VOC family protein [Cognatiyoonia sp. IB215182]MDX8354723.1 VOC family protein [Cognatiyoonia sp. IB215182]